MAQTYVPDDNFENELIEQGYDAVLDDSVTTANIDTVINLDVSSLNISDLTGIEDFTSLTRLDCEQNKLTALDLSQNTEHLISINYGDWNSLKNFISESEVENIKNFFEESLEEIKESDDTIEDCSQIYMSALYCNEEFVWEGTTF